MSDIPSTPADGNVRVEFVTTIANTGAPTAAEINAGSSVDFSCYITGDGFNPGLDEAVIADLRLCDVEVFEQPGRASRTLSITYIDNTNTADPNDAAETLIPGTTGYIVKRSGLAFDTAFAASQKVEVWPIKAGAFAPQPPEANSVLRRMQKLFVTARVQMDVAVA
jgi:hypothetical protein